MTSNYDGISTINNDGGIWMCPKCGTPNYTLQYGNGTHKCTQCGYDESSHLTVSKLGEQSATPYTPPSTPYNGSFGRTGWICPKCGRGVSPYTDVCPCQSYYNTITYSSNSTETK